MPSTTSPQPRRSPPPSHVDRLRLMVSLGMTGSAVGATALMASGVDPVLAAWLGLGAAGATGWAVLELAIRRIRSLTTIALARDDDPETMAPADRLRWLELCVKLPCVHRLDANEIADLTVLQRARTAGWIRQR